MVSLRWVGWGRPRPLAAMQHFPRGGPGTSVPRTE